MGDRKRVLHLVDDATAGGVMRVVDHILNAPELAELADHQMMEVTRGSVSLARYKADVIVSHLSVSWRNLPMMVALRAVHVGKTLIHVEHSYTERFVSLNVTRKRRFAALLRATYALFDQVVAVSEGQADWMRRSGVCKSRKLSVIQSCVDLAPFHGVTPRRNATPVLGAIGRLEPQKGFDTLISAFRQIDDPTLTLRIYGEGSEEAKLRDLAAGDGRIVFCGFASDPVQPYTDVDIVVMPSRWEAYGLVAIEALVAQKQLLCPYIDGLTDHAAIGAQVYQAGSTDDLSRALSNIVCSDGDQQGKTRDLARRLQARFQTQWRDVLCG